jgi:hypothetical protein
VGARLLDERALHRVAGGVGGMDDPPVAVPALAVKGTPWSTSHWIACAPRPTTKRTASSRHSPPPATWVSRMWFSRLSALSSTAAIPPWA